jgi:hypothetical protein
VILWGGKEEDSGSPSHGPRTLVNQLTLKGPALKLTSTDYYLRRYFITSPSGLYY